MNILTKLTNKYLRLNKKRTIVTIIGIILSGAMISAVTTLAGSFQGLLISSEIANHGSWEATFENVKYENIKYIENNDKFKDTMLTAEYSMGKNQYSDDEFIRIFGYSQKALENMEPKPLAGRLPENSNEIVLSSSFFDGKENEPKIGDKVTFELGKRISSDGNVLISSERENGEKFETTITKTYTVCGKINRPQFESYSDYYTSGITLLNDDMLQNSECINIGVITKKPNKIYEDTEKIADEFGMYKMVTYDKDSTPQKIYNIDYNNRVLMYKGVNDSQGFNAMLYSVCAILIAVIIVGSVLVIYNSFAISVSERKKQFGMLASIGATKKQIRKSVIYEGMVLGIIGIPLGILSGIVGIGITLGIVNNLLQPMLEVSNWTLNLIISWPSILIAALLIAATIYMSVIIPARRASKITPIDAIRQTDDIKVKSKKLKTPKFIRKIFKMPGELALKNLKRSKKRYRTTVISLVISIVLFVAVSGFVQYMFTGFNTMYKTVDYDYIVSFRNNTGDNALQKEKFLSSLMSLEEAKDVVTEKRWYGTIEIPEDKLSENIKDIINEPSNSQSYRYNEKSKTYKLNAYVVKVNDEELNRYAKEVGIKDLKDNQVILVNYLDLLQTYQMETEVTNYKESDNINISVNDNKEDSKTKEMEIAKVTNKYPKYIETDGYNPSVMLVVNENGFNNLTSMEKNYYSSENVYIKAKNVTSVEKQVLALKDEYSTVSLETYNIAENIQLQKNLTIVINIFLYGFISLISAIGIANIFNTISTNVLLRRREFANLKSIGMTDKQFKRMLNLECVFYGTKALLYGLPISVLICFLINKGFGNAVTFIFTLPWSSIFISILAVYIIVFATMIYSSRKVKKENIIDVIRDDNI